MILELLINDREMFKQETSFDMDMERTTAQFNESEPSQQFVSQTDLQSKELKRDISKKNSNLDAEADDASQSKDAINQYKFKLESLCQIYQQKLEEMNKIKEPMQPKPGYDMIANWQGMQMMNLQMNNQL